MDATLGIPAIDPIFLTVAIIVTIIIVVGIIGAILAIIFWRKKRNN